MTMHEDICYLDATELSAQIRAKTISPVEVVQAHLERIDAINPKLNAIVTMIQDAQERARAAEAAVMRGDHLGPLHGVPFTIKDCVDTAGIRTTRGSRLFAHYVPAADATVVTRLQAAGGIPLGKTNLPEFALWWETGNHVFGRTVNPWNPERTAGGSSGGEAAAIAAGLSPLGVGSDVGGSIRAPAHYCGIVGLKATHGRIPLTGHWPETLLRFMHVGPMARTVRDLGLALTVMAGPDGQDWYAMPVPIPDITGAQPLSPNIRIGWMAEPGFGPIDADVAAAVARAAEALQQFGCTVEPVRLSGLEYRDCHVLSTILFTAEAGLYLEPIIAGRHAELYPALQRRLSFQVESLREYLTAEAEVEGLRRDLAHYFMRYDVLLCPAVPIPAHPHEASECVIRGQALPPRHVLRATIPFDLTGSPALSVPFGWSREGLPIGVQVVGRHFDEAVVLRVGMALEAMHDATNRHPPL
jgi:Asp-tRNA(Asn)/Glu-tRNA(Gln) amidotransferase A subunit family amidase